MKSELLTYLAQLAAEKNLPPGIVFDAVEAALTSAYKSEEENAPNVYAKINAETGEIHAYMQKAVVDEVEEPNLEIAVEEAKRYKPDTKSGDVLDFEMKIPDNAGRIAAQKAKQVVLQRLREAERDAVYEEYVDKEGEVLVGTVQRVESRQMIVELPKGTEAALPASEQVRNEHLRSGQRVKVLILQVERAAKGPQVIVSRSHRTLLRRLFETEVPEISAGTVEIKSIAREGGHRSKVAVWARNPNVDPIGACVGPRGSRIQNIVNELGGERIDVIKWDPDPASFVSNALSPAQVTEVTVDEEDHRASVVVPDSMLSLAIGKEGQNARLAAKLTSWNIDIHSQSAADRSAEGIQEEPSRFMPFQPGEEPDIDIIPEEPVIEPEPVAPVVIEPAVVRPAALAPAEAVAEVAEEEEITFADAVRSMAVPKGEERESEDYGEEDDDEEYEVPTTVVAESRPTAIRFAEDVLPRAKEADDDAKKGGRRSRRASRFSEEEEDEMDEIDYSGRIH
jgi:N utilization substance protein A